MNDFLKWMTLNGLTRETEVDGDDRPVSQYTFEARCYSPNCMWRRKTRKKDLPKTTIFCPDCDYAILWKRKRIPQPDDKVDESDL